MRKLSLSVTILFALGALVIGAAVGAFGYGMYDSLSYSTDPNPSLTVKDSARSSADIVHSDFMVHFLELGNKFAGDCTYIKAGDCDILIDAGSRTSSVSTISEYIDQYVTDGKLEYVIVTHAHEDHYAGFSAINGSIFDLYKCGTIIDFAQTNQVEEKNGKKTMYGNYLLERQAAINKGATHYTAKECRENNNYTFNLGGVATMTILDQKFYYQKSSTENNHSVCTLFTYNSHNYLFTGDLEKDGEKDLIAKNSIPKIDVYKAGHHGSKTSSCPELMQVIQPKIVCVCCCCGSPEYTKTNANQFPTQEFINNIAPYTDKVYVTTLCIDYDNGTFESMNGNIVISFDSAGIVVCCGSGDSRVLKEWEWFKNNRTCPASWESDRNT